MTETPPGPTAAERRLEAEVRLLRAGLKQAERIRLLHSRMAEQLRVAIRERKRAETHLAAILRAALNGIVEIAPDGTILFANPAAHRIFGWPDGALVGRPIGSLVSPLEQEALHRGLARYFESGDSPLIGQVIEVLGTRRDGTRVPCDLTLAPVRLDGGARSVLAVVQDISVRKREEAEAVRLAGAETLRHLLEGITHGVKNPLFILTGRLQLLESKLAQPEYAGFKEDVEKVEAAVKRLTAALGQLDAFTRAHEPTLEPCHLAVTVEEASAFLADHLAKGGIAQRIGIAPSLPPVPADPHQLRMMVLNLMLFAIERMAAGRGTTLRVGATSVAPEAGEPERVRLRIEDDGPALPAEERARLFEPFGRGAGGGRGTGLELWTVRTTVMALKGTLAVESGAERGLAFVVELPAAGAGRGPAA